uniref:Uncharacterized protein n=1 Tax=Arundo donax TaxID=35708 RepID=A0A0A9H1X7_ARUDO
MWIELFHLHLFISWYRVVMNSELQSKQECSSMMWFFIFVHAHIELQF